MRAPYIATRQGPSEWLQGRFYLVPRDTSVEVPRGHEWCGPVIRRVLDKETGGTTIRVDDWGPALAPRIAAVVVIPAVTCRALAHGQSFPQAGLLYTRKPTLWFLATGDRLDISRASSRVGELLARPLAKVVGRRDLQLPDAMPEGGA